VQQALRVAMSSVDMNDPRTRERINKYKEERRTYLRQQVTSDPNGNDPTTEDPTESKTSPHNSLKSIEISTCSISSVESVSLDGTKTTSNATETTSSRVVESPRKRAFTDDVPVPIVNHTKAIKTEIVKSSISMLPKKFTAISVVSSTATVAKDEPADEINVKEKIALWTHQKTPASMEEKAVTKLYRPVLKESPSLPVEVFANPVLRREITSSSMGISRTKETVKVSRPEGGAKKIKDMAAFFEAKRF